MTINKFERGELRNVVNAAMKGDQSYESRVANTQVFYQSIGPATILALLDMIDRPAASGDVRAKFCEIYGMADDGHNGRMESHPAWDDFREGYEAASAERAPVVELSDSDIFSIACRTYFWESEGGLAFKQRDDIVKFARAILAAANGEQK